MAASVTTVDVLAAYGRQLHAVVPAQIGFSRGADGIVVRSDIKRINQLKGKTIATAQFTEVDFFIRYLAQEAGLADQHARQPRRDAASRPAEPRLHRGRLRRRRSVPERHQVGQEPAGRLRDVGAEGVRGRRRQRRPGARADDQPQPADRRRRADRAPRLRRAAPEDGRGPRAGPARRQPHGARSARRSTSTSSAARSSGRRDDTKAELAKRAPVEPAGEPRVLLRRDRRGRQLRRDLPVGGPRLRQRPHQGSAGRRAASSTSQRSQALEKSGIFKEQKVAIAPIRIGGAAHRSKPIRCSARTSGSCSSRTRRRSTCRTRRTSRTSRRSRSCCRSARARRCCCAATSTTRWSTSSASRAARRSCARRRCARWSSARTARRRSASCSSSSYSVDAKRLDIVGRGWEEPAGTDSDLNRRVEVQWFTIE